MNNVYHTKAFVIMNERVAFSVAVLLWIALPPSPCVCQRNKDGRLPDKVYSYYSETMTRDQFHTSFYICLCLYGENLYSEFEQPKYRHYESINCTERIDAYCHDRLSCNNIPSFCKKLLRTIDISDTQLLEDTCTLPKQPKNGRYESNRNKCKWWDFLCDDDTLSVPRYTILTYSCQDNYVLGENPIAVCIDTSWSSSPSCVKVCPPLRSTSVDISCSRKGETVSCEKFVLPGTQATLACKPSYKLPVTTDPGYRKITCLDDGTWDNYIFRCLPVLASICQETVNSTILESVRQILLREEFENVCFLPKQPEGGRYELDGCTKPCDKSPNDKVPRNSILIYSCKNNYILNGDAIFVYINHTWSSSPSCLKMCPPLRSTSVDIFCSCKGETVSCDKLVLPGTQATLACKPSYNLPITTDPGYRKITCLDDGTWDNYIFRCLPECGTSITRGKPLIVNGYPAEVGVFPWHVGIYEKNQSDKYEQICGGTLISSNLVISAAHCFYDDVFGKINNISNYAVGAGKYFRDWNATDKHAQKSLVESIRLGERYIGAAGNYVDDIALLKLETPFRFSTVVKPVCMDWDNQYEREQLNVQQSGKVVGWGKNINGESTKNLYEIVMPFVPYDQCLSEVPRNFKEYITLDKFCAGYLNGSSVCDGDSGGGLCFEKNGVWYLRGIVSVSPPKENSCDYNFYVGFTSVSNSLHWIRQAYSNASKEL